jgi:uncharacterized protein YuzE
MATGVHLRIGENVRKLEIHMIEPVRQLMYSKMRVDIIAEEFSAGYGFADLVGAKLCEEGCENRKIMGLETPLDHHHLVRVILSLHLESAVSVAALSNRIPVSESTLRNRVLPQLKRMGLIERVPNGSIKLLNVPPRPTEGIVAVEAKQTRWREAILQARRYTYFAEQSYIAVWKETTRLVDRTLLDVHKLGLISVELDGAEVIVEAPKLEPREAGMNWFCAEFLYGYALSLGSLVSESKSHRVDTVA